MRSHITTLLVLALGMGCQKSQPPGAEGGEAKTEKASSDGDQPERKKADEDPNLPPLDTIPTEDDFAEAAEKEITEDTDLDKELDALEKEISQ